MFKKRELFCCLTTFLCIILNTSLSTAQSKYKSNLLTQLANSKISVVNSYNNNRPTIAKNGYFLNSHHDKLYDYGKNQDFSLAFSRSAQVNLKHDY